MEPNNKMICPSCLGSQGRTRYQKGQRIFIPGKVGKGTKKLKLRWGSIVPPTKGITERIKPRTIRCGISPVPNGTGVLRTK